MWSPRLYCMPHILGQADAHTVLRRFVRKKESHLQENLERSTCSAVLAAHRDINWPLLSGTPPYILLWVTCSDEQARKLSKTKSSSAEPKAPLELHSRVYVMSLKADHGEP